MSRLSVMAALMTRACGAHKFLSNSTFPLCGIHVRRLRTNARTLHAASTSLAVKFRPLYVLVGTGGGYIGYRQYESYKDHRLENLGIEFPRKVAYSWEVDWTLSGICFYQLHICD